MPDEKLPVYDEAEIPAKLAEHGLAGWYLEDGWLRRKYTTSGWPATLMLVNAVGYLCEAAWHHADLAVTWGKVWVQMRTSWHMPWPLPPLPPFASRGSCSHERWRGSRAGCCPPRGSSRSRAAA
jgi:pterin-4a-carbinolamine dehydratase